MELNQFISNFADQFEETDSSEIKANTEFKTLDEWSSMLSLSIIAMIDAEYDVRVKGEDIRDCKTVEDLFYKVKMLKS